MSGGGDADGIGGAKASRYDDAERSLSDEEDGVELLGMRAHTLKFHHALDLWLATTLDPLYLGTKAIVDWHFDHRDEEDRDWWRAEGLVVEAVALLAARLLKHGPGDHHHLDVEAKCDGGPAYAGERLQPSDVLKLLKIFLPSQKKRAVKITLASWEGQADSLTALAQKSTDAATILKDAAWVTIDALKSESKVKHGKPNKRVVSSVSSAVATRAKSRAVKESHSTSPHGHPEDPRIAGLPEKKIEKDLVEASFLKYVKVSDMVDNGGGSLAFLGIARLKRLLGQARQEGRLALILQGLHRRAAGYLCLPEGATDQDVAIGFPSFWESIQLEPELRAAGVLSTSELWAEVIDGIKRRGGSREEAEEVFRKRAKSAVINK
jgi:hypothetical protein